MTAETIRQYSGDDVVIKSPKERAGEVWGVDREDVVVQLGSLSRHSEPRHGDVIPDQSAFEKKHPHMARILKDRAVELGIILPY